MIVRRYIVRNLPYVKTNFTQQHERRLLSEFKLYRSMFQDGLVDRDLFYTLWTEYFVSTDPAAKGNFLFGDV